MPENKKQKVAPYKPKTKEEEIFRKQMYADSLELARESRKDLFIWPNNPNISKNTFDSLLSKENKYPYYTFSEDSYKADKKNNTLNKDFKFDDYIYNLRDTTYKSVTGKDLSKVEKKNQEDYEKKADSSWKTYIDKKGNSVDENTYTGEKYTTDSRTNITRSSFTYPGNLTYSTIMNSPYIKPDSVAYKGSTNKLLHSELNPNETKGSSVNNEPIKWGKKSTNSYKNYTHQIEEREYYPFPKQKILNADKDAPEGEKMTVNNWNKIGFQKKAELPVDTVKPKLTNFEQRIQNPALNIKNKDGSTSTHKMMSFEADGKYYAAPTIVQQGDSLVELPFKQAVDYAFKNKEFKEFKTNQEASDYANNGYKKGTPLETKQAPKVPNTKGVTQNYTGSKALQVQGKPSGYTNKGDRTGRQEFRNGGNLGLMQSNPKQKFQQGGWLDGIPSIKPNFQTIWDTDKDILEFRRVFKERFGEEPGTEDGGVYNIQEAVMNGERPRLDKSDGLYHWSDKYKLPNHPTFSNQSKYYKPGMKAVKWVNEEPVNIETQNYTGSKALKIQGKSTGYVNIGDGTGRKEIKRNGGWLDGLEEGKTEQAPDVTNATEYIKGWYNSPMYSNILKNQNIDLGIKNPRRLERRVNQHKKYYNEENYNVTPNIVDNPEYYGKSIDDYKGGRKINLNRNFVKNNPKLVNSLFAHELAHDNLITYKDKEYVNKNTPEYNPAIHDEIIYNTLTDPAEVRSQIHSIRQLSGENKIYDPLTQPFKKEYLDKVNESYNQGTKDSENYNQLQRLRKYYSDDQITEMMNTISKSNSNDGKVYAKNGGLLNSLSKQRFDMGGTVDDEDSNTPSNATSAMKALMPAIQKSNAQAANKNFNANLNYKTEPTAASSTFVNNNVAKQKAAELAKDIKTYGTPEKAIIAKVAAKAMAEAKADKNKGTISKTQSINPNDRWMLGAANYRGDNPEQVINANKQAQAIGAMGAGVVGVGSIPVVSQTLGAGFAAKGVHDIPQTVRTVIDPNVSLHDKAKAVTFNAGDFLGFGEAMKGAKALGKFATEETALKNAYKLNPWAFKADSKMGYRMLGKEGFEDALNTGVLRAKPIPNQPSEGISLTRNTNRNPNTGKMQGALDRPYFADGFVDQRYASDYMAAVNKAKNNLMKIPTHKGIATPQAGSIPLENATLYKKNWLQGYKEVPKSATASSAIESAKTTLADIPKPTKETLEDAKKFLERRKFIKDLQKEGFIGKEFNLEDVNYAARSTDKTNKLTKLALEAKATRFRGVKGKIPKDGKGFQEYTGHKFDMSKPAWGNEISEFENMVKAGVDFNDPISIAKYQASHIPMEQYGYRSGMPDLKYADALYVGNTPTNYGNYQIKMNSPRDFSKGNYKDWLNKYYDPKNNLQDLAVKDGYFDSDFIPNTSYEMPVGLSKTNMTSVVGKKGQKMFDVDEFFPYMDYKNLPVEKELEFINYQKKLNKDFNTGWKGQYKNGGWLDNLSNNKFDMGGVLDGLDGVDKGTQVPDATATAKPVVNLNFAITPAQKQLAAKNKRQAEIDMQVDHPEFYINPNFLDKKAVKPYSVEDYKKGIKEPGLQTSMDPIDLVGSGVYKGVAKALGAKEVVKGYIGLIEDAVKYAEKKNAFPTVLNTAENIGYELSTTPKKISPTYQTQAKAELEKANNWSESWYNDPATKERLLKLSEESNLQRAAEINKQRAFTRNNPSNLKNYTQDELNIIFADIKPTDLSNNWDEILKNIQNKSYISTFQSKNAKLQKILKGQPRTHEGNYGLSGYMLDSDYKGVRQNLVNKYSPKIKSTGVHEGNHGLTDGNELLPISDQEDIVKIFGDNTKVPARNNKNQFNSYEEYLQDPTEVYARIMELREHFKMKPGEIIDDDTIFKIMADGEKAKTPVDASFFTLIKNPYKFKDLFNRLPVAIPAAIGVGALAKDKKQNGGWLNDLK